MKSLKIMNGDIVLAGGSAITVTGHERIVQELTCWLLEPLGTDVNYPNFGSNLTSMIGGATTETSLMDIKAEVVRIVGNYVAYQQSILSSKSDNIMDVINNYSPDDVIASVDDISANQNQDTVTVKVTMTMLSGQSLSVTRTI